MDAIVIATLVALVILIVKTYEKTLPSYPPAGARRAFCTTCIDLRFVETEFAFLDTEFGLHSYDIFAAPGPSYALSDPSLLVGFTHGVNTPIPKPPFADAFHDAWQRGLSVSQLVNTTSQVALVDHENCGYYNFYPGYQDGDYATRKYIQFQQMSTTLNYLKTLPTQYETEYVGYWVGLNGVTERVPS